MVHNLNVFALNANTSPGTLVTPLGIIVILLALAFSLIFFASLRRPLRPLSTFSPQVQRWIRSLGMLAYVSPLVGSLLTLLSVTGPQWVGIPRFSVAIFGVFGLGCLAVSTRLRRNGHLL